MNIKLFILAVFLISISSVNAQSFVSVKKSNGIEILEKWDTDKEFGKARTMKVVFTAKSNIHKIKKAITNGTMGKKWLNSCEKYITHTIDDNNWLTYIKYDIPWPVDDQDCVLKHKMSQSTNTHTIIFNSTKDGKYPVYKNINRLQVKGKWIIKHKGNQQYQIEYYIKTMPSKSLAKSITDPIIRNNTMSSFKKLKIILEG